MNTPLRGVRYFLLLGIALLAVSAVGVGWLMNRSASGTSTPASAAATVFGIHANGFVDVEDGISFLHPQPGRVVAVFVSEGEVVKEGDLLLSLDNRIQRDDLSAAEADLAAAERAYEDAKNHLRKKWQHEIAQQEARRDVALKEVAIAESELKILEKDRAAGSTAATENHVEKAKGGIAAKKEAIRVHEAALGVIKESDPTYTIDRALEMVKAKKALRDKAHVAYLECDLYAPADGAILRLFATPGDVLIATPKQPAVQFCPNKPRIVRAEVLQEWASKIVKGQLASIEDDTRSVAQWKGKVTRVSDWFTNRRSILQEPFQYNDVRTLECIIHLEPSPVQIRIGQRVRVTIK